jgi:hypothetical protein
VHGELFLCNTVARLATQPTLPFYRAVLHPNSHGRYQFLTSASLPVGVCLQDLQGLDIDLPSIVPRTFPLIAPWDTIHPACDLLLSRYARGMPPAVAYCRYFPELLSEYLYHTAVYTDGSFLQGSAGSVSVCKG